MIAINFMWGQSNIIRPIFQNGKSEIVYKMPVKNNKYEVIKFPVWTITDDLKISLRFEEANINE